MIIKDNMANMCAKVTSTYMEFTLAFGPKPEFSFSFKYCFISNFSNYILTYLIASCKHLFCFYKKFACLTHQRKIVKNA